MKNILHIKTRIIICASMLLLSIISTVSAQETQKIAIIDAGSSGSRLWVYEVKPETVEVKLLFPTKPEHNAKGEALSKIKTNSDSVSQFIDSIISKCNMDQKGMNQNNTIPLYVLATAGMRMIPQTKADSIYAEMNKPKGQKLHISTFRLDTAMTISGQYEGYYAWIAANAKAGKLKVITNKLAIHPDSSTVGILEIGGASMQIAFLTKDKYVADTISREGLGCIYSKSYLHYGVDRIFDRLGSLLTPNCLISLDKIDGLYDDLTGKFVGLSKPIEIVFDNVKAEYSTIIPNITKINENRKNDSYGNYHPATNAMYIDWVVYQLSLGDKLYKPKEASDWTEGAALDIIINKQKPQSFENN